MVVPPGQTHVYLAPFRPRTATLGRRLPTDTWLVRVPSAAIHVAVTARGDSLVGELGVVSGRDRVPRRVATIVIDLAIAREALLRASDGATAFTEAGDATFARIERALASMVSRARLRELQAHFADGDGRVYRVDDNLGGDDRLVVVDADGIAGGWG